MQDEIIENEKSKSQIRTRVIVYSELFISNHTLHHKFKCNDRSNDKSNDKSNYTSSVVCILYINKGGLWWVIRDSNS